MFHNPKMADLGPEGISVPKTHSLYFTPIPSCKFVTGLGGCSGHKTVGKGLRFPLLGANAFFLTLPGLCECTTSSRRFPDHVFPVTLSLSDM